LPGHPKQTRLLAHELLGEQDGEIEWRPAGPLIALVAEQMSNPIPMTVSRDRGIRCFPGPRDIDVVETNPSAELDRFEQEMPAMIPSVSKYAGQQLLTGAQAQA